MSRHWRPASLVVLSLLAPVPLAAQDEPPETIDILVPPETYEGELEDCSAEQEAASISGEIIVCRRRVGGGGFGYDPERAEREYATRTMNRGAPKAPDVFGIPDHGVVVARGCFIPPCPPPPALIIDVGALPEAPAGSDADRIARGLNPTGEDTPAQPGVPLVQRELGLPPPSDAINPSESASPTEEPSG
ncbi:hypothetical protein [Qipengyuania qiaonensis]|uniref:Uncharacterized protein n=1 Tax=Qipengyuania qiaonensis TaxID=2867240 RepID=A0ABS7J4V4_9SPHN|nr:hypothetical protein [Qipengyuania qiaonensis]MBX7482364.1 hypothetical protein [Qipengyuania qiaonensis]